MKNKNFPCPCGGKLIMKKEEVVFEGINCGVLDVEYCKKCGEMYLPEESAIKVEEKLKEKKLWGIKRKEVSFWKSGKSFVIRLPTDIAEELKINHATKGHIYPEGENKLVIEL